MADIKPKSVNFSSQINSRDYYKGTSFRWAGVWEVGKLYSNDTFFVDFVSWNGKVYVCIKSHYASNNVTPANSEYWNLAVDSAKISREELYNAYVSCGGTLSDNEFYTNFSNIVSVNINDYITKEEVTSNLQIHYYTKEEIDSLLDSDGSVDMSNYYTKDEINQTFEAVHVNGGEIDGTAWM